MYFQLTQPFNGSHNVECSYLSTSDPQLDLALASAHQLGELLADALQQTQSVVLGQSVEEILDSTALVSATSVFLELGHNL